MDAYDTIARKFQDTLETIALSVDQLAPSIESAGTTLASALLNDGKILVCGLGPDAALAQLLASHLLTPCATERPALPALMLTPDSYEDSFSRQLRALGGPADALVCINSGGAAPALARVTALAQDRNMPVVLLSNEADRALLDSLTPQDTGICVTSAQRDRTIEIHTMIMHCLCTLVERTLFGHFTDD